MAPSTISGVSNLAESSSMMSCLVVEIEKEETISTILVLDDKSCAACLLSDTILFHMRRDYESSIFIL